MVQSYNYQQTQHAVCLLMINALDQCGPFQRSRVTEDSWEICFLSSSVCFLSSRTLLSAKLDDQWGNSPALWGLSVVCRFCLKVRNALKWQKYFIKIYFYFSVEC